MANPSSRLIFVLGLLVFYTLALLDHQIGCHAQKLFVFGDGLYDAGNKQFLSVNNPVAANSPPYGVTVGRATGRWSDGLIIPDYLAKFMGIPHVPPILDTKADFSRGASFAVADATVLGAGFETMTFVEQVLKFSQNKNKWTDIERSDAIYLFYIGGEDYLNYTKNNPNPSEEQKQDFVDLVLTRVEAALKHLHKAGGRRFASQNLAPLGCLPIVKQEKGSGEECVKLPTEMAELHNKKLLQSMKKLALELDGFKYTVYDFFSSIQRRVAKSKTYTFDNGNTACCGTGSHNASGCATNNVCAKPEEYLFFDGMHLSEEANEQTGHLIFGADPEVISPINLRELVVLPLDAPSFFSSSPKEPVQNVLKDATSKIHNAYDIGSLEWGVENQWPYQFEGASSFVM